MIGKLVALSALVAVASASLAADRYPAGLNPALCPNYPHCDNLLLALHGNGLGVPVAPQPTVWGGREYPAGVSPAACPNYPYCNTGAVAVAPLPGWAQREYPAGVSPAACPNYPYCH
ncbi:cuticle protein 1-like [Thrips palmi]|uniref:Cuticle protein 1-like n=1 Tax=Thrips palmi TaxID=161013 RepID=A0A6P9ACF1_THRPL|nr:cuticle protein 1-like [Thrips palmi]